MLDDIRFTPEALAGIYLGRITQWDDPLLRASNRGIRLAGRKITVVHRSDRSGTTFVWTTWLSAVSRNWQATVGARDSVQWPVGMSAEGNAGVADAVTRTPDSIGYVEFIYALQNRLSYAAIRNSAGRFVQADLTNVPAAAADFASAPGGDFRAPIMNPPGCDSYPVTSLTWLLVPEEFREASKGKAMNDFLIWMLTSGQRQCAALGYTALPAGIADQARRMVESGK